MIKFLSVFLALAFLGWSGCEQAPTPVGPNQGTTTIKKYNRLGAEKSPYLQQHKNNPVNWFAWSDEALQAAREENKLIFLSIGYSTCYWCHVMEKDSFERQDVADTLNKDFISIKVDREERPDVDTIYMDAVVKMTGRGGWPMSVFLTPDLKPFFGGTFFRRAQFLQLLSKVQQEWQSDPKSLLAAGASMHRELSRQKGFAGSEELSDALFKKVYSQLQRAFDSQYGGFGRAPKFPRSVRLSLLLRMYQRSGSPEVLKMVTETLDAMARGGLYDQVGGGFHRYSTDEKWLVPHFEKMLYDNALLAWIYLEAYQVTGNPHYAQVARETLDYVLRDMTDSKGGFYSAEDAGEVGKEGEFYIWTAAELKQLLTPSEFKAVKKTYGVTHAGNFEKGHNILHIPDEKAWKQVTTKSIQSAKQKIFNKRQTRTRPHLDDKVLTAWNGLMIAALAKGSQVLGEPSYLAAAEQAAAFIKQTLVREGRLWRRYREGQVAHQATINDYAYLIFGLLNLYEADFKPEWLRWAEQLQAEQDKRLWDETGGGYFFAVGDDPSLIIRPKELNDGAIPAGNAVALSNLLRLYDLTFKQDYQDKAGLTLAGLSGVVARYPAGFEQSLIALDYFLDRAKEVAVIGQRDDEKTQQILEYLYQEFLPNKVIAVGEVAVPVDDTKSLPLLRGKPMQNGLPTVYVCEENTCKQPTNDLGTLKQLMSDRKKFKL